MEDGERVQGVTVVIHKDKERGAPNMDVRTVKHLSIFNITCGLLAIVLQVLIDILNVRYAYIQEGILAGVFYIVTGVIGISFCKKKTRGLAIAFLVFSILSSLWSLILLVFSSIGVAGPLFRGNSVSDGLWIFANSSKIIISVLQGIVTIICSSLSCKGFCCSNSDVIESKFQKDHIKVLSIIQICVGGLFIIFYFINVYVIHQFSIFEEIWCSVFFIGAGILGLFATRNVSPSLVTAFLVINIFGSLLCIVLLTTTAIKTSFQESQVYYREYSLRSDLTYLKRPDKCEDGVAWMEESEKKVALVKCLKDDAEEIKQKEKELEEELYRRNHEVFMATLAFQLILVLVQSAVTVCCAILSCRACCCLPRMDTTAVYIPQDELAGGRSVIHVSQNSNQIKDRFEETNDGSDNYRRFK